MNVLINSIKYKSMEKKLAKTFEMGKSEFGLLESLAVAILTCPKLFLKNNSLLRTNKYVTFDLMLVSFSYAAYMMRRRYIRNNDRAEGDLLGYVYAGANSMYGLTRDEIMKTGRYRIKALNSLLEKNQSLDVLLRNLIAEATILFAHDIDAKGPKDYSENSPLTILPINVQTRLEREAYTYLTPMFESIDRIISNCR